MFLHQLTKTFGCFSTYLQRNPWPHGADHDGRQPSSAYFKAPPSRDYPFYPRHGLTQQPTTSYYAAAVFILGPRELISDEPGSAVVEENCHQLQINWFVPSSLQSTVATSAALDFEYSIITGLSAITEAKYGSLLRPTFKLSCSWILTGATSALSTTSNIYSRQFQLFVGSQGSTAEEIRPLLSSNYQFLLDTWTDWSSIASRVIAWHGW